MKKEEYYNKHPIAVENIEQWIEDILKIIDNDFPRILDVGCGEGSYSCLLKDNKREVWGIEPSEKAAAQARRKIDQVIIQDAEEEWKVPSGYFDAVVMLRYLEHVFDYDFQLQEARRVLKDRGSIIIFSPNMSILERLRLLFGRYPKYADNIEHIRQFTKPFLFKILEDNDFEPVYCKGWGFIIPKIDLKIKIIERINPNLCPCLTIKAIKK